MVIKEQNTPATVEETNSAMDDTFGCGDTGETPAKTHIISQEIKFARALAGNDAKLRRKVLKNLETWLTTRSQSTFVFSDADFLRLWKGLFYCMWMSDKPLVQEELAESLGALVRCFQHDVPVAVQFFKAFLVTMGIEWFGIDRWRTDKFMMLVRRVTRQMLFLLHETDWQTEHVALFVKTIEATILDSEVSPFGLTNHFNDLLLEEVAKVSEGDVPKGVITQLLEPYVRFLMQCSDKSIGSATTTNIFHALFRQSELGQAFEEKFELWKRTGFIHGHIDKVQFDVQYEYENENEDGEEGGEASAEKDEDGEENDDDDDGDESSASRQKVYDPRAGRVSVTIPEIEFDCEEIIALFEKYRYKSFCTTIGKKSATLLVKQFRKFADGIYPLGIQRMPSINPRNYRVDIEEQIEDLEEFRRELYGDQKATNWKERKREIRLQKKLAREQQRQAAGEADGTDGAATEQDGGDKEAAAEPNAVAVVKKKKSKKRKLNPTELKKQQKLELLKRKKEEKMKLLKERLKQAKKKSPTNETVARKMENNSSSSVDENAAKPSSKKKLDMSSDSLLKSPTAIQPSSTAGQAVKQANVGKKNSSKNGNKQPFQTIDEWSEPPKDGEEEYFIPSRKLKKAANSNSSSSVSSTFQSVGTPVADAGERKKGSLKRTPPTAAKPATDSTQDDIDPVTPARKRVKIALNKNVAQELAEHVKQVKSSPQMPFDSAKKPAKSLLKPNLIPSPVNPFYKKKIGLK